MTVPSPDNRSRPNVLLIICDDLGWGDLGCYGSTVNDTPRIDAMAQEGLRLTDHYAPAPICTPSRAGLMTGCYPYRHALDHGPRYPVLLPGDDAGLDSDAITLADVLRDSGYATGCFGKWHLGDRAPFLPTDRGFDQFLGLPYSHDMRPSHKQQDEFHFPPLPVMEDHRVIETEPAPQTLDDRFTDAAIAFIKQQTKPWFAYVALTAPHVPLHPTEAMRAKSRNGDYGAVIATIDACVGRMLDALDRPNDTIVILTSDHGAKPVYGGDNGPFRGGKNTTLEGGMRVPCVIRWPRAIPALSTSSQLTSHLDLLPTLAKFADAALPADQTLDGEDIGNAWLKPDSPETSRHFLYYNNRQLQAVRHGDWKLHLPSQELFNLTDDPAEQQSVAAQHPDTVQQLLGLIENAQPC